MKWRRRSAIRAAIVSAEAPAVPGGRPTIPQPGPRDGVSRGERRATAGDPEARFGRGSFLAGAAGSSPSPVGTCTRWGRSLREDELELAQGPPSAAAADSPRGSSTSGSRRRIDSIASASWPRSCSSSGTPPGAAAGAQVDERDDRLHDHVAHVHAGQLGLQLRAELLFGGAGSLMRSPPVCRLSRLARARRRCSSCAPPLRHTRRGGSRPPAASHAATALAIRQAPEPQCRARRGRAPSTPAGVPPPRRRGRSAGMLRSISSPVGQSGWRARGSPPPCAARIGERHAPCRSRPQPGNACRIRAASASPRAASGWASQMRTSTVPMRRCGRTTTTPASPPRSADAIERLQVVAVGRPAAVRVRHAAAREGALR